ncbi:MAG: hypothetical protein LBN98_01985 [Prevotellaceae bacterium]|nr:hypothetical protein [Prevotellaceae bacterium]
MMPCDTSSQPAATHRRSLLRHIVAACCDTPSQPAATHRRNPGEAKPAGIQELRIGRRRPHQRTGLKYQRYAGAAAGAVVQVEVVVLVVLVE